MKRLALGTLVIFTACQLALPAQAQGKKSSGGVQTFADAPVCSSVPETDTPLVCQCPAGASGGPVWGSGPYTADSDICMAALHAGVVGAKGGALQLVRRPGQGSYEGTNRNGVSTSGWGSYGQSFDVFSVAGAVPAFVPSEPVCDVLASDLEATRCICDADVSGSVWGSGPYTADSNICSAARHAGVIGAEGGLVKVLRMQGLDNYSASQANGESTSGWSSYDSSITFDGN